MDGESPSVIGTEKGALDGVQKDARDRYRVSGNTLEFADGGATGGDDDGATHEDRLSDGKTGPRL